ncbi:MAG: DUF1800 domain-containing protein [Acidobacteriota bacterium]
MEYADAAHLLRRAGFGGSTEEIDALAQKGTAQAAVDYLLNYTSIDNSSMEQVLTNSFNFTDPTDNATFNQNIIRTWWVARMVFSKRQFEEKMTLFWHNHFATALSKVQDRFMYIQNLTLRQNALARFDDLLLKVAQDPAMLLWLDTTTSTRTSPNENFARELQELFTMGIKDVVTGQANYTEDDIKQIARAFTGWRFRRTPGDSNPFSYLWFVDNNQFDAGPKTVYGQTANYTGQDIISIVSAKPATARYLVYKMFTFFVYPLDLNSQNDKSTIDKFASIYMSTNHSIRELMRAILTSDEFYSNRARYGLVKQPIELIVSALRSLKATYNPGIAGNRQFDNQLQGRSRLIGEDLFNPPDVAGWDFNMGWINTTTMLERFNFANQLATTRQPNNTAQVGFWIPTDNLRSWAKPSTKKTVRVMLDVMGPVVVSPPTNKELRRYLSADDAGNQVTWVVNDTTIDKKIRGLIHQIMSLPEFQMN